MVTIAKVGTGKLSGVATITRRGEVKKESTEDKVQKKQDQNSLVSQNQTDKK